MTLQVFSTIYGVDSIEFIGDTLHALIYEVEAPASERSVAVPLMTKDQLDKYIVGAGGQAEDMEDYTTFDYYCMFEDLIKKQIETLYPHLKAMARLQAVYIGLLLVLVHIATALLLWCVWYVGPVVYLIGMVYTCWFAKKHNFLN